MRAKVTEEFFEDRIDEFTQRYATVKAPAFVCDTTINEEIICVLPLVSYCRNSETHNFVIDYEDLSTKRARWNATTNIIPSNGGSDVEISIIVSANAHKSYKIPYPSRMRYKIMEGLLCGHVEDWLLNTYDVLDDFSVRYVWASCIECTDIHNFYKFRFHADEEVTDITELVLR